MTLTPEQLADLTRTDCDCGNCGLCRVRRHLLHRYASIGRLDNPAAVRAWWAAQITARDADPDQVRLVTSAVIMDTTCQRWEVADEYDADGKADIGLTGVQRPAGYDPGPNEEPYVVQHLLDDLPETRFPLFVVADVQRVSAAAGFAPFTLKENRRQRTGRTDPNPGTHPGHQDTPLVPDTGGDLIAAERARQVTAHGYTAGHDARHDPATLARAAAAYLLADPDLWPFADTTPTLDPPGAPGARALAKAGALAAAALDRLTHDRNPAGDRDVAPAGGGPS